jgi:hypothetical protein
LPCFTARLILMLLPRVSGTIITLSPKVPLLTSSMTWVVLSRDELWPHQFSPHPHYCIQRHIIYGKLSLQCAAVAVLANAPATAATSAVASAATTTITIPAAFNGNNEQWQGSGSGKLWRLAMAAVGGGVWGCGGNVQWLWGRRSTRQRGDKNASIKLRWRRLRGATLGIGFYQWQWAMAFDRIGNGQWQSNRGGCLMDAVMDYSKEMARQRRQILQSTTVAVAGDWERVAVFDNIGRQGRCFFMAVVGKGDCWWQRSSKAAMMTNGKAAGAKRMTQTQQSALGH